MFRVLLRRGVSAPFVASAAMAAVSERPCRSEGPHGTSDAAGSPPRASICEGPRRPSSSAGAATDTSNPLAKKLRGCPTVAPGALDPGQVEGYREVARRKVENLEAYASRVFRLREGTEMLLERPAGPQLEGPTGSLPIVRISEEARATEEEVAGMIGVVACEKGAFAQAINKRNSRAVGLSDSESFAVCYPDGSIAALVLRDKLSPEGAAAWKEFEGIHDAIAVPWALGCEAEANTDPQRVLASLKTPEGAAGLRIVGGFHVSSIGARSGNTDNKLMVTYTNREGKEIVFGTGGCPVDRHRYSSTEVEHIYDRRPAVAALLGELRELYAEHTLPFMRAKGFPAEVIDGLDPLSGTELASIVCNEHMKRMGIHHDPLAPLPAGIAGPTGWELREEIWRRQHKGGRLFLADGLFCLEYRPRDLVLLDGRFAHGVSSLRELGGQESVRYRPELRRFSTVLFSRWKSEKVKCEKTIRKAGLFATWDKKWWDSVPWKEGKWPAGQEGGGGPLGRGHRTRVQAVRYTDSATEGRQGGS